MYVNLIGILSLGFLLGMRHATDADHVVAVTTIIARQKKGIVSTALIGILWGLGHSITVTLVAVPIILYSFVMPPRLGLFLEFTVGLMLVILGILNFTGITSKITRKFTPIISGFTPLTIHKHLHFDTGSNKHSHLHMHSHLSLTEELHHLGIFQALRPIVIGFVHGLAGSAAIALLILSTIHNPILSVFYLFIFHTGVLTGMMIITLLIGASVIVAKRKSEIMNHYLIIISGLLSLIFGLYIMYQTAVNDGLFSSVAHWNPQ